MKNTTNNKTSEFTLAKRTEVSLALQTARVIRKNKPSENFLNLITIPDDDVDLGQESKSYDPFPNLEEFSFEDLLSPVALAPELPKTKIEKKRKRNDSCVKTITTVHNLGLRDYYDMAQDPDYLKYIDTEDNQDLTIHDISAQSGKMEIFSPEDVDTLSFPPTSSTSSTSIKYVVEGEEEEQEMTPNELAILETVWKIKFDLTALPKSAHEKLLDLRKLPELKEAARSCDCPPYVWDADSNMLSLPGIKACDLCKLDADLNIETDSIILGPNSDFGDLGIPCSEKDEEDGFFNKIKHEVSVVTGFLSETFYQLIRLISEVYAKLKYYAWTPKSQGSGFIDKMQEIYDAFVKRFIQLSPFTCCAMWLTHGFKLFVDIYIAFNDGFTLVNVVSCAATLVIIFQQWWNKHVALDYMDLAKTMITHVFNAITYRTNVIYGAAKNVASRVFFTEATVVEENVPPVNPAAQAGSWFDVPKQVKEFVSFTNGSVNLGRNVALISSAVVAWLWTRYMLCVHGVDVEKQELASLLDDGADLIKEYDRVIRPEFLEKCRLDYTVRSSVTSLKARFDSLLARMPASRMKAFPVFSKMYSTVSQFATQVGDMAPEIDSLRVVPVAVCLKGPPCIGKNIALTFLRLALAKVCELPQGVITRNNTSAFWSGLSGQRFCIINEFGSTRSPSNQPDPNVADFLNIVSSDKYLLPVELAEEKSRAKADFDFVFLTTNCRQFDLSSLIETKAFDRRVHFSLVPFFKQGVTSTCEGWGRNKFNVLKEGRIDKIDPFTDLSFKVIDSNCNFVETLTFSATLKLLIEKRNLFQEHFRLSSEMSQFTWLSDDRVNGVIGNKAKSEAKSASYFSRVLGTNKEDEQVESVKFEGAAAYLNELEDIMSETTVPTHIDAYRLNTMVINLTYEDCVQCYKKFLFNYNVKQDQYESIRNTTLYDNSKHNDSYAMCLDLLTLHVIPNLDHGKNPHDINNDPFFDGGAPKQNKQHVIMSNQNHKAYILHKEINLEKIDTEKALSAFESIRNKIYSESGGKLDLIVNGFNRLTTKGYTFAETSWDYVKDISKCTVTQSTVLLITVVMGVVAVYKWGSDLSKIFFPETGNEISAMPQSFDVSTDLANHVNKQREIHMKEKKNQNLKPKKSDHSKYTARSKARDYKYDPKLEDYVVTQVGDRRSEDLTDKVLRRNVVTARFENTQKKTSILCNGFFCKSNVLVFPRHLHYVFDPDVADSITLYNYLRKPIANLVPSDCDLVTHKNPNMDLMLVRVEALPAHCDIVDNFPDRGFTVPDHIEGHLLRPSIKEESPSKILYMDDIRVNSATGLKYTTPQLETITCTSYASYRANTNDGDCGSLLFVDSDKMSAKIIGYHIAGSSNGTGYSQLVTKEDLKEMLTVFENDTYSQSYEGFIVPVVPLATEQPSLLDEVVGFNAVYQVPNHLKTSTGIPKTKLIPSPIVEDFSADTAFPSSYAGAVFSPGQDAIHHVLKKKTKLHYHPPEQITDEICDGIYDKLMNVNHPLYYRTLTFEEAWEGIHGEPFVDPMPRTTSTGWPYSKMYPGCNKGLFLNDSKKMAKLKNEVEALVEQCKVEVPVSVFNLFVKDELRPKAKLLDGMVRLIAGCPIATTVAVRMYYGKITAWIMRNNIANGIAVGMNPYGHDWVRLTNYVLSKGHRNLIALDAEGFEYSHSNHVLRKLNEVLIRCCDCTKQEATIMRNLWSSIANCHIIYGSVIYSRSGNMASGCPLTSLMNSLLSFYYLAYGWLTITDEVAPEFCSMRSFDAHVALAVYGDDTVGGVSDVASEFFNPLTIKDAVLPTGVKYTTATKDEITKVTFQTIETIDFLKRSFRYHKDLGRMVAPLSEDTLVKMVSWINTSPSPFTAFCEKMDTACIEASLHGKEFYLKFTTRIKESLRRVGGIYNKVTPPSYLSSLAVVGSYSIKAFSDVDEIPSAQSGKEQFELTTFNDDATDFVFKKENMTQNPKHNKDAEEQSDRSLISFLKRPVQVSAFTLSNGGASLDTLFTASFPDILVSNVMYADKLKNFRFLRANVHIKIVTNASPYALGRFLAFFAPYEDQVGVRNYANNISSISGYPGAFVDIGSGQAANLLIPYCSPFSSYDILNGFGEMGDLILKTIVPYNSADASDCDVTVFAWFDDITLSVPTPQTAPMPFAQSGKEIVAESVTKSEEGVITKFSGKVFQVSNALESIPLVGPYASMVSAISGGIHSVAKHFGFCKESNVSSMSFFTNIPTKGFTNVVGLDDSTKLAAHPLNALQQDHTLFASSVDEMSIHRIISKESLLTTFTWSGLDAVGTILKVVPVSPGYNPNTLGGDPANVATTPLGYVTSMFRLWRGSIKYKLDFVKNGFYSGRVGVAFVPGASPTDISPATNFAATVKDVFDVRMQNEMTLTVPYVNNVAWATVQIGADNKAWDFWNTTGCLVVYVINQLKFPSLSPNAITGLIGISGTEDFAFAIPEFSNCVPVDEAPPVPFEKQVSSSSSQPSNKRTAINQNVVSLPNTQGGFGSSGDPTGLTRSENPEQVMLLKDCNYNGFAETACIGESVTSLREIIKRSTLYFSGTTTVLTIDPNYFTSQPNEVNAVAYISRLFRFWRGGMRYKIFFQGFDANNPVNRVITTLALTPWPTSPAAPNVLASSGPVLGKLQHVTYPYINPTVEVEIPFYQATPFAVISSLAIYNGTQFVNYLNLTSTSLSPISYTVYSAAADDFSFGYQVGTPYVYVNF
jgi:hypothetical protein